MLFIYNIGFRCGLSPHRHPFPARPAPRRRGSPLPRSAQRPHLMTRKFNPLWLIGVCEFWLNSVNIYVSRFYKQSVRFQITGMH